MPINIAEVELFTVQQLATFLHKKPATIYCDITRRPQSLPPIFRAPGSLKPLFLNPRQWVLGLIEYPPQPTPPAPQPTTIKPKRGRPSHASKKSSAGGEK